MVVESVSAGLASFPVLKHTCYKMHEKAETLKHESVCPSHDNRHGFRVFRC